MIESDTLHDNLNLNYFLSLQRRLPILTLGRINTGPPAGDSNRTTIIIQEKGHHIYIKRWFFLIEARVFYLITIILVLLIV